MNPPPTVGSRYPGESGADRARRRSIPDDPAVEQSQEDEEHDEHHLGRAAGVRLQADGQHDPHDERQGPERRGHRISKLADDQPRRSEQTAHPADGDHQPHQRHHHEQRVGDRRSAAEGAAPESGVELTASDGMVT